MTEPGGFNRQFDQWRGEVERYLPDAYPALDPAAGGRVVEAARYSLMAGGKRIRPVLLLAVTELLGGDPTAVMPFAAALEMVHTYSLIHDDLPCMDDDDLRRGRPTCHVVYGEAIAVLAGDALLNRAFELVHAHGERFGAAGWQAASILSNASGSFGMIGGQALDIEAEGREIDSEALTAIHVRKTGALLKAPVLMAAALCGCSAERTALLDRYAAGIGLAFQVRDDILDVAATPEQLGKTPGKDARDHKTTYVSLYGLDDARLRLGQILDEARQAAEALRQSGLNTAFLVGLADYLALGQS